MCYFFFVKNIIVILKSDIVKSLKFGLLLAGQIRSPPLIIIRLLFVSGAIGLTGPKGFHLFRLARRWFFILCFLLFNILI